MMMPALVEGTVAGTSLTDGTRMRSLDCELVQSKELFSEGAPRYCDRLRGVGTSAEQLRDELDENQNASLV